MNILGIELSAGAAYVICVAVSVTVVVAFVCLLAKIAANEFSKGYYDKGADD